MFFKFGENLDIVIAVPKVTYKISSIDNAPNWFSGLHCLDAPGKTRNPTEMWHQRRKDNRLQRILAKAGHAGTVVADRQLAECSARPRPPVAPHRVLRPVVSDRGRSLLFPTGRRFGFAGPRSQLLCRIVGPDSARHHHLVGQQPVPGFWWWRGDQNQTFSTDFRCFIILTFLNSAILLIILQEHALMLYATRNFPNKPTRFDWFYKH